jgi:hypothetical protein
MRFNLNRNLLDQAIFVELIFTDAQVDEKQELTQAINSFDALKIISYVRGKTVREKDYSHRVLCIVPSEDFRTILNLDFLSKYVAEKIVDKVTDDSINELSAFYVANCGDDSGMTAVV